MPTTYAHYLFGKRVYEQLPQSLQAVINQNRGLYDIGVHGPDLLFYYHFYKKNPINTYGFAMHNEPAHHFFTHALKVLPQMKNQTAAWAYLYGFITHFTLDMACHSYVEKMEAVSGISHNEIETEFDRYLLEREGKDPLTFYRATHLHPSPRNAQIIAAFFSHIAPRQILSALKSQCFLHRVFMWNCLRRERFLYALLKKNKTFREYQALVMNSLPNPKTKAYGELLNRQLEKVIPTAVSLIEQFEQTLLGNAPLPKEFDLDFGPQDGWEQLPLV